MTTTIQTENTMTTTLENIRKGDVILTNKGNAKITNIEFTKWQNEKVAHFSIINLNTLDKKSFGFMKIETQVKKVLDYENIEQKDLKCQCGKKLGNATFKGLISLKCPKCKTINDFTN